MSRILLSSMHHNHQEHHHLDNHPKDNRLEYVKFAGIISGIIALSFIHSSVVQEFSTHQFIDSFMGVFFIVFAAFKLINLKEFAYGFQSYDILAKRSLAYSFVYPFIQAIFGILYLLGATNVLLHSTVLLVSLVSGVGVLLSLSRHAHVHCVCLGNVVKLPLSTISFVEDFGMAAMATIMLMY